MTSESHQCPRRSAVLFAIHHPVTVSGPRGPSFGQGPIPLPSTHMSSRTHRPLTEAPERPSPHLRQPSQLQDMVAWAQAHALPKARECVSAAEALGQRATALRSTASEGRLNGLRQAQVWYIDQATVLLLELKARMGSER